MAQFVFFSGVGWDVNGAKTGGENGKGATLGEILLFPGCKGLQLAKKRCYSFSGGTFLRAKVGK